MGCLHTPKFDRFMALLGRRRGFRAFARIFDDDRGAVMVMFAAVSPIILGVAGLAVEASYWQLHQRAMQNAANSAAIAAGMEGGTNYVAVANAVAAQYGFVNGSGNVTVNVTNPTSATGCASNCYSCRYPTRCLCCSRPLSATRARRPSTASRRPALTASAVATQMGGANVLPSRPRGQRRRRHHRQRGAVRQYAMGAT